VITVSCDVTSSDQVSAALQRAVDAFGRIDIAFNNAGVEQRNAPLADITEPEWERASSPPTSAVSSCV
jgi:NAD(P)-dependent dehydrogenase (short-subunit alcohol dehydrogenase family)